MRGGQHTGNLEPHPVEILGAAGPIVERFPSEYDQETDDQAQHDREGQRIHRARRNRIDRRIGRIEHPHITELGLLGDAGLLVPLLQPFVGRLARTTGALQRGEFARLPRNAFEILFVPANAALQHR